MKIIIELCDSCGEEIKAGMLPEELVSVTGFEQFYFCLDCKKEIDSNVTDLVFKEIGIERPEKIGLPMKNSKERHLEFLEKARTTIQTKINESREK